MPQALDRGSGPLEGTAPSAPSPETRPASVPGKAAQKRGPPGARRRSQTVPCPADDLWPDVSASAGPVGRPARQEPGPPGRGHRGKWSSVSSGRVVGNEQRLHRVIRRRGPAAAELRVEALLELQEQAQVLEVELPQAPEGLLELIEEAGDPV